MLFFVLIFTDLVAQSQKWLDNVSVNWGLPLKKTHTHTHLSETRHHRIPFTSRFVQFKCICTRANHNNKKLKITKNLSNWKETREKGIVTRRILTRSVIYFKSTSNRRNCISSHVFLMITKKTTKKKPFISHPCEYNIIWNAKMTWVIYLFIYFSFSKFIRLSAACIRPMPMPTYLPQKICRPQKWNKTKSQPSVWA